MTSYQKLKAENLKLKEDIGKILDGDHIVIAKYRLKKEISDSMRLGDSITVSNSDIVGLLPYMERY